MNCIFDRDLHEMLALLAFGEHKGRPQDERLYPSRVRPGKGTSTLPLFFKRKTMVLCVLATHWGFKTTGPPKKQFWVLNARNASPGSIWWAPGEHTDVILLGFWTT